MLNGFCSDVPDKYLQRGHNFESGDNKSGMRVLKFNPISINEESKLRFKEHVDFTTFTIHLHESTPGVQVKFYVNNMGK